MAMAPGLRPDGLSGAILYYDAQVDDARYVVAVVRTAAAQGAAAVNRVVATGFLHAGERVMGAMLRDEETGAEMEARARVTVLATGAWTEETERLAGQGRAVQVRPSKGVHLVVSRQKLALSTGLITRTERSVLFVLPWGEHWLIGTTDTDWDYSKSRPLATVPDVDYLLAQVNAVVAKPLARADVEAVFAGLRPLVAGAGVVRGPGERADGSSTGQTAGLSREHSIGRPSPGLVVVSGGKYTTYRVMAADAVDAAVAEVQSKAPRSTTNRVPLVGARDFLSCWDRRDRLAQQRGLPVTQVERLLHRYGALAADVLSPADRCPSLLEEVEAGGGYLGAEFAYAVTHEGARHLDDVLSRRTRVAIETSDGGSECAPEVARIMAPLLGWGETRTAAEVDDYRRQVGLVRQAAWDATSDEEAARLASATPSLLPFPPTDMD